MPTKQVRRWCRICDRYTLHARKFFSDGLAVWLCVFTLGLFLPIWILIKLCEALFGRWQCQTCGQKRVT